MSALRDWGHARDYVEMQWLMLQQNVAEDFVIATGEQHSVREFVEVSARELGIHIRFTGEGEQEVGIVDAIEHGAAHTPPACKVGDVVVRVDPRYFRPTEVETLLGDPARARERLGWVPTTTFEELVREMVQHDYTAARRDALVRLAGFKSYDHHE
jgi:GDPmannose 4,6-dehydratase